MDVLKRIQEYKESSSAGKAKKLLFNFFSIMREYGYPPQLFFGGKFKITGTIGEQDVDLTLEIPAFNSDFLDLLFEFEKYLYDQQQEKLKKK